MCRIMHCTFWMHVLVHVARDDVHAAEEGGARALPVKPRERVGARKVAACGTCHALAGTEPPLPPASLPHCASVSADQQ